MIDMPRKLESYLLDCNVAFELIEHQRDYSAQRTAADTHTRGKEFAKTILLEVDGNLALAVLPAHMFVDCDRLADALRAETVKVAPENEMREVCPDCEVGAIPPLGNLYDLPVYVAPEIAEDERITFNAGTHEHAMRMRYSDFERLASPHLVPFAYIPH